MPATRPKACRPSQSGWNNNFADRINSLIETCVSGGEIFFLL